MRYVLFYDTSEEAVRRAPAFFPAHQARWKDYLANGTLEMVGPFADPRDGAMAVFRTREAAESFATGDPFVLNGVVTGWRIKAWNEAIHTE